MTSSADIYSIGKFLSVDSSLQYPPFLLLTPEMQQNYSGISEHGHPPPTNHPLIKGSVNLKKALWGVGGGGGAVLR